MVYPFFDEVATAEVMGLDPSISYIHGQATVGLGGLEPSLFIWVYMRFRRCGKMVHAAEVELDENDEALTLPFSSNGRGCCIY